MGLMGWGAVPMGRAPLLMAPLAVVAMAQWEGLQIMGKIAVPVELTTPTEGPSEVNPVISLIWSGRGQRAEGGATVWLTQGMIVSLRD